jgi:hypothetical protein
MAVQSTEICEIPEKSQENDFRDDKKRIEDSLELVDVTSSDR